MGGWFAMQLHPQPSPRGVVMMMVMAAETVHRFGERRGIEGPPLPTGKGPEQVFLPSTNEPSMAPAPPPTPPRLL